MCMGKSINRRNNYDYQNMDRCEDNDQYNEWLDDYNRDKTQPFEIPSIMELMSQFGELSVYEAGQIIIKWKEDNSERIY